MTRQNRRYFRGFVSSAFPLRFVKFEQHRFGAQKTGCHRTFRQMKQVGDFLVFQSLAVAHNQQVFVLLRQSGHRELHIPEVFRQNGIAWIGIRVVRRQDFVEGHAGFPAAFPVPVDGGVFGILIQKQLLRFFGFSAEFADVPAHFDERVRDGIFRVVRIFEDSECRVIHHIFVFFEQRFRGYPLFVRFQIGCDGCNFDQTACPPAIMWFL